jgi:hypothetical protein
MLFVVNCATCAGRGGGEGALTFLQLFNLLVSERRSIALQLPLQPQPEKQQTNNGFVFLKVELRIYLF